MVTPGTATSSENVEPRLDPLRAARERAHGEWLSENDPEFVWGWGTPAGQVRARRRAQLVAQHAWLGPGVKALEIGCGTGMFSAMWAESGAEIVAVDISEDLIARARQRELPEQVQFKVGRFEEMDAEGPFDAVIGSSILHHLELRPALRRIAELLQPGGRLAFAEPNMLNPQVFLTKNVPLLKRWAGDTPDETAFVAPWLLDELNLAGFVSGEAVPFDWLHPRTPAPLIERVSQLGSVLELIPGLRAFAGSLLISATRNHVP